jgi:hypothetical protein
MLSVLIGIAAGAAAVALCALLRWLPSSAAAKVLLGAYLVLSGAWAGFRWTQVSQQRQAAIAAVTAEKVAAVTGQFLPREGTAGGKMPEQEGESMIREVTEKALGGVLPPQDTSALRDALLGEAAGRRLADRDGYIKRERMRRYLYTEVPEILEVRLQAMADNRRTRLFGAAFILLLIGVTAGAFARQLGRGAQLEETAE